ncbi:MAG: hypothetical protein PQJ46_03910 [Spirochaetales bacterium]|nr:hypothetical protein [Spirochaetales bacterium]
MILTKYKDRNKTINLFKTIIFMLLPAAVILFNTGCSVVFTCSMTGSIVDSEKYDNGDEDSGIDDLSVFLYTDEDDCNEDLLAWSIDNSVTPDNPSSGDPKYFIETTTDDSGDYTFNGLIWNELFSEYGKSGDRKEVFLLFYHKNYGLCSNPTPVYVVSDVTNRVSVIQLDKIMNTADINGTIYGKDTSAVLANVTVNIWVPTSWTYDSDGNVDTSSFEWDEDPSYTALSDESGEWSQEIAYYMKPSSSSNNGTTIVRLTYDAGGYVADNAADSDITDGGWDINADGTIDSGEDDGYYQTDEITKGTSTELNDIYLANEYNTATISGSVVNTAGSNEDGVTVEIYVPDSWSYTSTSETSIDENSITWPENPSYTVTTDEDGEYTQAIQFDRLPSEHNNYGTTKIRIIYKKDNYIIDSSTDSALTDGGWDMDDDGTTETTEDDAYYEPSIVYDGETYDYDSITIKQTRFTEDLTGQVQKSSSDTTGVNGVEVWMFFNVSSAPSSGDEPDYTTTTSTQVLTTDEVEKGYFSFSDLQWTDESYTGNQSKVTCYVYLPTTSEQESGSYAAGGGTLKKYLMTSDSDNNVTLAQ